MSASYLSRLFKKETGLSVSSYIRQQKIEMAKNLLRFSDSSMIEIANQLAFSSQSHFIQQFREVTGITPKKYRDESRLKPWIDRFFLLMQKGAVQNESGATAPFSVEKWFCAVFLGYKLLKRLSPKGKNGTAKLGFSGEERSSFLHLSGCEKIYSFFRGKR